MKIVEFKALIKSLFKNDKVSFSQFITGTSFSSDGSIMIRASIKKGWDYELPNDLYLLFQSKNILIGSVNDALRLSHRSTDIGGSVYGDQAVSMATSTNSLHS